MREPWGLGGSARGRRGSRFGPSGAPEGLHRVRQRGLRYSDVGRCAEMVRDKGPTGQKSTPRAGRSACGTRAVPSTFRKSLETPPVGLTSITPDEVLGATNPRIWAFVGPHGGTLWDTIAR